MRIILQEDAGQQQGKNTNIDMGEVWMDGWVVDGWTGGRVGGGWMEDGCVEDGWKSVLKMGWWVGGGRVGGG